MRTGFLIFSFCVSLFAREITLSKGSSETLNVKGLARAAIADTKIARVRAIPPATLLITGVHPGKTKVRFWTKSGEEQASDVTVLAPEIFSQFGVNASPEVVKVSLQFLEMDVALSRTVGIRWPEALRFTAAAALAGDTAMSGLNYSVSFASAQGWMSHLVRDGWARILANPDLYVRLGESATFHSGGEFPVPSSSENFGRYQRQIEWKPFGITVKVRPQSGDKFHINSDIHVEISEVSQANGVEGIPSLTRRDLDTKMNSRDGETVILSGLVRQASSQTKEGLPWLSSIPLLGLLFSQTTERREGTEVMMAVTFSLTTRERDRETLEEFRTRYANP